MDIEQTPPANQTSVIRIATYLIFLSMLSLTLSIHLLAQWVWRGPLPNLVTALYRLAEYILMSFVIWLYRDNLQKLNIKTGFLVFFIFNGLYICLFLPSFLGLIQILIVLCVFLAFISGKLKFGEAPGDYWSALVLIAIAIAPKVLLIALAGKSIAWLNIPLIIKAASASDIPEVIVEEVLFRGMLWMFLKDWNLSTHEIIMIQAIAFWLPHYFNSQSLSFWVFLLFQSIVFGLIVWRSKSLGPSMAAHFLNNFLNGLVV